MAISINGPTGNQVGANKAQKSTETAKTADIKPNSGTDTASTEDVVELSDRARVLKAVETRIQQMPDIDQDKVDRIRNAISNGEYQIDYDKLAAAFRRFENGL